MATATGKPPTANRLTPTYLSAAVLIIIVVTAATLRLINLGAKSLWLDETYRIYLASMSWHDFLRGAIRPFGANSIVFHLILRYWMLFGKSDTAIRSLSVVFGVATVVATYNLGVDLFDQTTALIAAALASTNALLITYSQEVCAYTLATLLAVVASWYFCRALQNNAGKNWVAYTTTATLMVYCHVLSWLVVLSHCFALLLVRRWRVSTKAVASLTIVSAAFVLLAWCIAFRPPHPKVWLPSPTFRNLGEFVANLAGPVGVPLGLLFVLFVLLNFRQSRGRGSNADWRLTFLLVWAFCPPILLFLTSQ